MATFVNSDALSQEEAIKLFKVSVEQLRQWQKKGLLRSQLDEKGSKIFSKPELTRLTKKSKKDDLVFSKLTANKNTATVIELFCGAGGLALGLSNAGFQTELLVDFDKTSIQTLKKNRPEWNAICESVTELDLKKYKGKIDVMAGGFPCQSFSYAGDQLGLADMRGTLFYEYLRLIKQVKPKIVIGENVKGLLTHDEGRTFQAMLAELKKAGYRVGYKLLKAQFLDVPQKRERLVIFGIRKDLDSQMVFPEEKDYTINLRQALKGVPASPGMKYSVAKEKIMKLIPEGGYWKDLPIKLQQEYMGASFATDGGKTGMARRLSWSEPSLTLTCSPAQKQTERCHPSQTRPLTVREYARIQCFPDDWQFAGSISSQYKQIGNAVPVNLGYHIGLAVRQMLGLPAGNPDSPAKLIPIK
jgi:DNA (cytosine-5)-methyltransferase 1